jgi:hypothetical protein
MAAVAEGKQRTKQAVFVFNVVFDHVLTGLGLDGYT